MFYVYWSMLGSYFKGNLQIAGQFALPVMRGGTHEKNSKIIYER